MDVLEVLELLGTMASGTKPTLSVPGLGKLLSHAAAEIRRLRRIEAAAVEVVQPKAQGIELALEHGACQTILALARVDDGGRGEG